MPVAAGHGYQCRIHVFGPAGSRAVRRSRRLRGRWSRPPTVAGQPPGCGHPRRGGTCRASPDGTTTADTLTATGAARIREAGPNAMVADAGPAARNLLDTALERSGPGSTAAREAVEQRATQANQQLRGTLDQTMGAPVGVETRQAGIRAGTAPARQQAYDAAYNQPIDYSAPAGRQIEGLLGRVPQEAVNHANRLMRAEGQAPGNSWCGRTRTAQSHSM